MAVNQLPGLLAKLSLAAYCALCYTEHMADLMIDIEGLGTGPDTTILTIAAQSFDPLGSGYHERHYYARIELESQQARSIQQDTID